MPEQKNPFFDSVWTRPPRSRSGQPTLSREQIVRAAIELLDAEGTGGLSMRRLGTRLGSGATSLYWHVANKEELLELTVDEVLGECYVPEVGDTSWRIGVSIATQGMRLMILRHPWVMSMFGTKPTIGPNAMRNGERMVALLLAAGFDGVEVSHVSTLLNSHAIGSATTQAAVTTHIRKAGIDARQVVEKLEPYLDAIAPDHPQYDRWRRQITPDQLDPERMWEDSFKFGLERLLDGLELWLSRQRVADTSTPTETA
ncbi:TetR/AcrR family transcriptional regulator [Paractinoplanes rishiriensis]|uniref:TetR family transcriptional regulator n=1 Tax=Paractinoplanes rishiriensis TaxID=1050105 RepID=A0A919K184_9ACTN|nr:TetR/AcrR family transcriptional regulator C-terminal domain-containing protein [Actinoplanes rishiriensis]GIE99031.1 TetR family transcriptional regulator [Actinoplanes rishiriensis]